MYLTSTLRTLPLEFVVKNYAMTPTIQILKKRAYSKHLVATRKGDLPTIFLLLCLTY